MKSPDEICSFDKGKVEIAKVGDTSIGRIHLEPGWSWEKCVKPIAKTESCQAPNTQYVISGRMRVSKSSRRLWYYLFNHLLVLIGRYLWYSTGITSFTPYTI